MLIKLEAATASPTRSECFTLAAGTRLFVSVMVLIGVFAAAFEVLRPVDRNVVKIQALATGKFAFDLLFAALKEVMVFVRMVTKAFGRRPHVFAGNSIRVVPSVVKPVFCFLGVVFFILGEFLLRHHHSAIVSNQITVLLVLIDMLSHEIGFYVSQFGLDPRHGLFGFVYHFNYYATNKKSGQK